MIYAVCLSVLVASALGQNFNGGQGEWYCGILGNENCATHQVDQRCGTDGVTYINMCALGQAHCSDNNVHQLHNGSCSTNTLTTRSPSEVVHGSEIVLDIQCSILSHRTCEDVINEKICATDGVTYPTFCEYEKQRCTHRDLHVKKLGDCNA